MKRMLLFIAALAFGCADHNIKLDQTRSDQYMVFGDFYGMCAGECVRMYLLNENSLFEDSDKRFPVALGVYQGNFSIDRSSQLKEVKEILTQIPQTLIQSEASVLGCPDCSDGGAMYIETKIEGQVRYWLIDKQRVPAGLEDFVRLVNEKLYLLEQ